MPSVTKRVKETELREQMKALNEKFAKKVAASGLIHQEIKEAVEKARKDVREARRSSGN
jgi:hypothetical protein